MYDINVSFYTEKYNKAGVKKGKRKNIIKVYP